MSLLGKLIAFPVRVANFPLRVTEDVCAGKHVTEEESAELNPLSALARGLQDLVDSALDD